MNLFKNSFAFFIGGPFARFFLSRVKVGEVFHIWRGLNVLSWLHVVPVEVFLVLNFACEEGCYGREQVHLNDHLPESICEVTC